MTSVASTDDLPATVFTFGGETRPAVRPVPVEVAVAIVYGTVPYAVMMATPDDLEDFAVGFSLTEGVIAAADDIRGVRCEDDPNGVRLIVDLVPGRFHTLLARRRAMAGRTGCGICGIEDLASIPRVAKRDAPGPGIQLRAIQRALGELASHQTLNATTHAVHAAAWARLDGSIAAVREDVGRHNAVDKIIGAALAHGEQPDQGFIVITSRCSHEMVEKAAAFGVATLVAISAPTSLGVERARHHGMTLVAIARQDAVTVFAGAERIKVEAFV